MKKDIENALINGKTLLSNPFRPNEDSKYMNEAAIVKQKEKTTVLWKFFANEDVVKPHISVFWKKVKLQGLLFRPTPILDQMKVSF